MLRFKVLSKNIYDKCGIIIGNCFLFSPKALISLFIKKNTYMLKHLTTIMLLAGIVTMQAQVNIVITGTPVTQNFTGFTGLGFTPTPAVGQLDADNWQITGCSDGDLLFGGTKTTGDFARGSTGGIVTTGGIYGFSGGGGTNQVLYFQPTADDLTPGDVTLRYKNITGTVLTELDFSYVIFLYNNESRSTTLKLSYSLDNITFLAVPSVDFTSLAALDASLYTYNRSVNISGLSIPNNTFIYFKWTTDDAPGGAGSRDEIGIDDITLTASSDPVPTPTVYFNNDIIYANENDGSFSFNVNIATPHDCNVFITLNPAVTYAKPGIDYTLATPYTVTFTAGGPTIQTITVPLINDAIPEYTEAMYFELDSVSPGCLIVAPTFQLVFIEDTDVAVIGNCENLIISQYGEGTGVLNNKALEIYNPTDASINLADYYVQIYTNGSAFPVYYFQCNGMLASGDAYVITTEDANPTLLAQADSTGQGAYFNGNDAVTLYNGPYMIDKIGEIGVDPGVGGWTVAAGSTTDNSLVRKSSVKAGQLNWAIGATEWNVIGPNNFAGLNAHTFDGCGCPMPTGVNIVNITSSSFKVTWTAAVGATKYQVWYRPTGVGAPWAKANTTSTSKKIIGLTAATTYEVKVKTICGVESSEFTALTFVTTNPLRVGEAFSDIEIFPNPSNGVFTVEMPSTQNEIISWAIYDLTGKLIIQQAVQINGNTLEINAADLSTGNYILQIICSSASISKMVSIE